MNCERCQTELEDFLYGESSERLSVEMRAHLADCAECIALRDELAYEHELFAQFYERTAIDPTTETWDVIRTRIAAEPARQIQPEPSESKASWWQSLMGGWLTPAVLRQAALALLLVALSVVATIVLMKRGDDGKNIAQQGSKQEVTPPLPAPSPTTSSAPLPTWNVVQVETPAKSSPSNQPPAQQTDVKRKMIKAQPLSDQELITRQLARAEREYQGVIKMLDRAVAKRRDEIQPEAFKQYQASLALIDSSIAQSKRALRERPEELSASQFLLAAYARKVELMQTIAMN